MLQNVTAFRWTQKSEQAAGLAADDKLSDEEIAQTLGMARQTLARWRKHPEFAARVQSIVQAARDAVRAEGISNKQNRIAVLQDRHNRIEQLIAARATELCNETPGGATGLLVRTAKVIKVYEEQQPKQRGKPVPGKPVLIPQKRVEIIYEYTVDTALLKEDRATLEQVARELGEWTEKREVTGADGEPLFKVYAGLNIEDV